MQELPLLFLFFDLTADTAPSASCPKDCSIQSRLMKAIKKQQKDESQLYFYISSNISACVHKTERVLICK